MKTFNHMESGSAESIAAHIEDCYKWLFRMIPIKSYASHAGLALDYGKRGTRRFFSLSLFIAELTKDKRFDEYLHPDYKELACSR